MKRSSRLYFLSLMLLALKTLWWWVQFYCCPLNLQLHMSCMQTLQAIQVENLPTFTGKCLYQLTQLAQLRGYSGLQCDPLACGGNVTQIPPLQFRQNWEVNLGVPPCKRMSSLSLCCWLENNNNNNSNNKSQSFLMRRGVLRFSRPKLC